MKTRSNSTHTKKRRKYKNIKKKKPSQKVSKPSKGSNSIEKRRPGRPKQQQKRGQDEKRKENVIRSPGKLSCEGNKQYICKIKNILSHKEDKNNKSTDYLQFIIQEMFADLKITAQDQRKKIQLLILEFRYMKKTYLKQFLYLVGLVYKFTQITKIKSYGQALQIIQLFYSYLRDSLEYGIGSFVDRMQLRQKNIVQLSQSILKALLNIK